LEVVLLFPAYAHILYGGYDKSAEPVNQIVSDAQLALHNV
jgi:hypothetical protein